MQMLSHMIALVQDASAYDTMHVAGNLLFTE